MISFPGRVSTYKPWISIRTNSPTSLTQLTKLSYVRSLGEETRRPLEQKEKGRERLTCYGDLIISPSRHPVQLRPLLLVE